MAPTKTVFDPRPFAGLGILAILVFLGGSLFVCANCAPGESGMDVLASRLGIGLFIVAVGGLAYSFYSQIKK